MAKKNGNGKKTMRGPNRKQPALPGDGMERPYDKKLSGIAERIYGLWGERDALTGAEKKLREQAAQRLKELDLETYVDEELELEVTYMPEKVDPEKVSVKKWKAPKRRPVAESPGGPS